MAAGAWQVYTAGIVGILEGTIDLEDTTHLRMALVTSSYTPDQDTHATWADVSANEVANGGGYTTHGKLLAGTVASATNVITFDCDDQSWTSSTITAKYAVIVEDADADNALASTDLLIAYVDLETGGGSVSTTNGTFAITINASGVFTVTQTN